MIYFPSANTQNKEIQMFGVYRNRERFSEQDSFSKKGSTKSALMTFNSHNTVEDNDVRASTRSSGIKGRKQYQHRLPQNEETNKR